VFWLSRSSLRLTIISSIYLVVNSNYEKLSFFFFSFSNVHMASVAGEMDYWRSIDNGCHVVRGGVRRRGDLLWYYIFLCRLWVGENSPSQTTVYQLIQFTKCIQCIESDEASKFGESQGKKPYLEMDTVYWLRQTRQIWCSVSSCGPATHFQLAKFKMYLGNKKCGTPWPERESADISRKNWLTMHRASHCQPWALIGHCQHRNQTESWKWRISIGTTLAHR